jgi:Domain of unknown function (DUF4293)
MLQRIQSLWLLAAAVCSFLTLKFEFYAGTVVNNQSSYLNAQYNILFTILAAGIGIACLITIFLYKQRKLQMRIAGFTLVGAAIFITLLFLKLKTFTAGTISLWSVFYFAIPVLLILAMRGIWKDEKLIKSMDKLR